MTFEVMTEIPISALFEVEVDSDSTEDENLARQIAFQEFYMKLRALEDAGFRLGFENEIQNVSDIKRRTIHPVG